ncbi:addiction module protein [Coleofasciculus chthonoplastes]|uniref:addiction module protein n=1 Tax=Coleofasciculus chthonoplastes TaxID=64178 RepID=UPI0005C52376
MSISQPLAIPPGFEQLSKEQQIDYVQQLWDLIIAVPEQIPVPEWHLEIVRDRVSSQDATQKNTWNEVKQRLMSKYNERKSLRSTIKLNTSLLYP